MHLQLLKEASEISGPKRDRHLIFPSPNGGTLSESTIPNAFSKLGLEAVSYGFRSTFREWCSRAGVPFEVAELAVAHKLPPVVAAYVRGDLLENRVRLMQAWSDLLEVSLLREYVRLNAKGKCPPRNLLCYQTTIWSTSVEMAT